MRHGVAVPVCCLLAFVAGCKPGADRGSAPAVGIGASVSPWRTSSVVEGGRLRTYLTDAQGANRILIRSRPPGGGDAPAGAPAEPAVDEIEATRLWMACKTRVVSGSFPNSLVAHDAWLETAERLERRLQQDPDNLGVLRDLVSAYVHLVEFEADTPLGSNICLLAGRRISEFERKAAPLDPVDARDMAKARVSLFYAMKLYPCVVESLKEIGDDGRAKSWRQALAIFDQADFTALETFPVGRVRVRVYQANGAPPDPRLLWEELYFIISGGDRVSPEGTTAYVLVHQGPPGAERYFLYFRALNRSQLALIYGTRRPDLAALRSWVVNSVQTALAGPQ